MASGAVAQAVAFLIIPIVSRLYPPHMMGVTGLFMTIGGILLIPAGGRYEQALVVAPDRRQRRTLLSLTLCINLLFALLLWGITLVVRPLLKGGTYAELIPYLPLLPLYVLLTALFAAGSNYAVGEGAFTRLSVAKLIQGLGNSALKVLLPLFFSASVWLLLAALLESYLLGLLCFVGLAGLGSLCQLTSSARAQMRTLARQYAAFPKYTIVQAGVNTLLASLLVLMLSYGYTTYHIGLVTMALMLAKTPLRTIADSLSQAYFHRAARLKHNAEPLSPITRKVVRTWLWIALPAGLLLYLIMPWLIGVILEAQYAPVADIIRLMLPLLLVSIPNSVLNVLPDVLGAQRRHMQMQTLFLAVEFAALLLLLFLHLPLLTLIAVYFGVQLVDQVVYAVWLRALIRRYERTCPR